MAKYIVTGGAGFVGSHLTRKLLARGNKVVVIDNLVTGHFSYLPPHENLTFLNVDISDWNSLSKNFAYLKGSKAVFHLAAVARIQPSIYSPHLTHESNVTGTLNILEMMRMCDIPGIIYSGSSSYYGLKAQPPSKETDQPDCQTPYAISKYMGELYCDTWSKLHDINVIRLRYFNVWGERSPLFGSYAPVVSRFLKQTLRGEAITVIGDGSQRRDFTHVSDVVDANLAAAFRLPHSLSGVSEVYNIGTGTNYSILELANKVKNLVDCSIEHVPERIGESKNSLADNSQAKRFLSWEPKVSLDEGLVELCAYYKENIDKIEAGLPV